MANAKRNAYARNWELVKLEYVTGEISLRDLASKNNIPFSTLGERAVNEEWEGARKQYRNNVVTEAQKRLLETEVSARVFISQYARRVISEYLEKISENAPNADDALNVAKLLLVMEGEPDSRTEILTDNRDWRVRAKELGLDPSRVAERAKVILNA